MDALITRYGLLAVFVGAALEGDMVVILSGVAAHLGLLHFPAALAMGWLGAVVADCVCYSIGRNQAAYALQTNAYKVIGPHIEGLVGRLGERELLIARFIFGTRVVSMLYWGIQGLPLLRFATLDMIGCAVWATFLTSLGYGFSGTAAVLMGDVKRVEIWLLVALLVAAAATALIRRKSRRYMVRRPGPP